MEFIVAIMIQSNRIQEFELLDKSAMSFFFHVVCLIENFIKLFENLSPLGFKLNSLG